MQVAAAHKAIQVREPYERLLSAYRCFKLFTKESYLNKLAKLGYAIFVKLNKNINKY